MSLAAGKLRVLIATTNGPVEVQLLTEEDAAIGRCVACIGGTTETADIASAYHAFVVRPTGVIEGRFGHSCYRLDVSGRIDTGSSWQLGVLAAHALLAAGRLAQENDVADGVLWATGSVRPVDLTVGAVSHVPEKLANSLERLKGERVAGRPVLVAVPAGNLADVSPSTVQDLWEGGIELVAVSHAQALFDALAMKLPAGASKGPAPASGLPAASGPAVASGLPAASPPAAAPRRRYAWAAAVALLGIAAATAVGLVARQSGSAIWSSRQAEPVAAPPSAANPPPASQTSPRPEHVELVPELVPFVTAQDRERIRNEYLSAPNYKALATSLLKMAFVSGQPSQEAADRGAMEACERIAGPVGTGTAANTDRVCDLYASGTFVVTHRNTPALPPMPWINASVTRPFDLSAIPLADQKRKAIVEPYPEWPRSKAVVLSPNGTVSATYAQSSPDEAMRRTLERCGYTYGAACLVVAVDDTLVIPVPTLAKVVGFYRPEALFGAQPDERKEVGRRLAGANGGWNAVAVGAAGHLGTKTGAASERSAVDGAMEDCASHDQSCRIAVIGPFLVEGPPASAARPAEAVPPSAAKPSSANPASPVPTSPGPTSPVPTGPGPEHVELVPALVPFITAKDRERIRNEYMSAPNYKALATSLVKMAFVSGQPSQEAADRGAMEACEKGPAGTSSQSERVCELYASGTFVVTHRNAPALPSRPWINASVTRPFDVSAIPMMDQKKKGILDAYPTWPRSKAVVLTPTGFWHATFEQSSPDEAMRRSLERCGYLSGAACLVVAVDDSFVIPVPTLAKAVGFYRPEGLVGAQPDERAEAGRRLAAATDGWNAVAVGAAGHVGTTIGAASERSAVDGAIEDCASRDHNCRIAVIGPFLVEAPPATAEAVAAPPSAANPSPTNLAGREAGHVELVPALVPFVIEKDKERIRNEYMSAPNYKALATSLLKMAFVSGQPSQEAADHGAMEACEKANGPVGTGTEAKTDRICDLYASGTFVVTHRNAPALPPMPWINASVTRPFDVSAVPMLDLKKKGPPDGYPGFARSKAMVLSPNGIWYGTFAQSSPDEAMRRSLERCGYTHGAACLVVAVDDSFVIPVPTLAKAVEFYRPEALVGAQPDERKEVGRRLAGANAGWNAVAVGAAGHLGTKIGAASERSAVDGAMEDCANRDRNCRIAVIGPFLVEALPASVARAAPP